MKTMQILRNPDGEVVATAEVGLREGVPVMLEAAEGQVLEEIELPEGYNLLERKSIQIVRSPEGLTLATVEAAGAQEIPVSVELEQGQVVEEMEVSGNYMLELGASYQQFGRSAAQE